MAHAPGTMIEKELQQMPDNAAAWTTGSDAGAPKPGRMRRKRRRSAAAASSAYRQPKRSDAFAALPNADPSAWVAVSPSQPSDPKRQPVRSFAHGVNFYKLFWIFFISCFVGVLLELAYCFATQGFFESRSGLVYGPFNLVYGFGGLFMTLGLSWLAGRRDVYVFLGGFAIGSVVEYGCSWVQQTMFGTVSWEYSHLPLNLNGRISLLYSFFWGILALVWIKEIYPHLSRMIERIPNAFGKTLTWILLVFMIVNTVMSGLALERMAQRRSGVVAANAVQAFFDGHFPDERLKAIYANMSFVQEDGSLDALVSHDN